LTNHFVEMVQKKANKNNKKKPKREEDINERVLTSMELDENLPNMEGLLSFEGNLEIFHKFQNWILLSLNFIPKEMNKMD
jgi:hypothetical protein